MNIYEFSKIALPIIKECETEKINPKALKTAVEAVKYGEDRTIEEATEFVEHIPAATNRTGEGATLEKL